MAYLVLAYPKISKSDYDWIQAIRKKDDKIYYGVVEPHFTIVFATDKLSLDEFTAHVQDKIQGMKSFDISLDTAKTVKDDFQDIYHAFLIPSKGYDEITKLHDVSYTGTLASELREDLPYIPHVGIGTNQDEKPVKELAEQIDASGRQITGSITELTIVEYDGTKVANIVTIPFKRRWTV